MAPPDTVGVCAYDVQLLGSSTYRRGIFEQLRTEQIHFYRCAVPTPFCARGTAPPASQG